MSNFNWILKELHLDTVNKLVSEFSIPASIASIMSLRGLSGRQDSIEFFKPSLDKLHDPFLMADMDKAVDRVIQQIKKKDKVMIFGDYDVDGSCSTALLIKFFKSINHPFFFYIPDRIKDGYGPSVELFKKIMSKSPKLIIMVDCGSKDRKSTRLNSSHW